MFYIKNSATSKPSFSSISPQQNFSLVSILKVQTFPLNRLFSILWEFSSFHLFLQIFASIPRAFCTYLHPVLSTSLLFYFSPKEEKKKKSISRSRICPRPRCLWKSEDREGLRTVGQYTLISSGTMQM